MLLLWLLAALLCFDHGASPRDEHTYAAGLKVGQAPLPPEQRAFVVDVLEQDSWAAQLTEPEDSDPDAHRVLPMLLRVLSSRAAHELPSAPPRGPASAPPRLRPMSPLLARAPPQTRA